MAWSHRFYHTHSGNSPVETYIADLNDNEFEAVRQDIALMDQFGPFSKVVDARPFDGKLWYLRVRTTLAHRIYYVAVTGQVVVYLHAINKKSQRAPKKDIALAKKRMAEVLAEEERRKR